MKFKTQLNENDSFNPLAYLEKMPKFTEQFANWVQSLVGTLAVVELDNSRQHTSYLRLHAPSNDYIDGGIIYVTDKLISAIRSEVEKAYPNYTIEHNNTATSFWITERG
jgi:hypothetical protein